MNFPEKFKDFEECEKFFADKNAGMFHGDNQVAVRILSNDSNSEEKCIYNINDDRSLTRDSKPVEPETKSVTNFTPEPGELTETAGETEAITVPEPELEEDE